jgi:hypothetical protein
VIYLTLTMKFTVRVVSAFLALFLGLSSIPVCCLGMTEAHRHEAPQPPESLGASHEHRHGYDSGDTAVAQAPKSSLSRARDVPDCARKTVEAAAPVRSSFSTDHAIRAAEIQPGALLPVRAACRTTGPVISPPDLDSGSAFLSPLRI